MTNIEEGNIAIELFCHPNRSVDGNFISWNDAYKTKVHISNLDYDKNWGNLMTAILVIGNINIDNYNSHQNTFYPRTFGMKNEEGEYLFRFNTMALYSDKELIKAAWLAVTGFIQWLNNQKPIV